MMEALNHVLMWAPSPPQQKRLVIQILVLLLKKVPIQFLVSQKKSHHSWVVSTYLGITEDFLKIKSQGILSNKTIPTMILVAGVTDMAATDIEGGEPTQPGATTGTGRRTKVFLNFWGQGIYQFAQK